MTTHGLLNGVSATTDGGPVAIMKLSTVPHWSGGRDYFAMLDLHATEWIQAVTIRDEVAYFFHLENDGEYHVYFNESSFAVVSSIYTPTGEEPSAAPIDLFKYLDESTKRSIPAFGGALAIFDSALQGKKVLRDMKTLDRRKKTGKTSSSREYDVVLLEFPEGPWDLVEIHREDQGFSYDGVYFQSNAHRTSMRAVD